MLIPYRIAFVKDETYSWWLALLIIDGLFGVDIILCFMSTYLDEEQYIEIDDRKLIAKNYLSGWFTIDLSAIFPFDIILQASDVNGLVRFARIGRLYKLVKLTRLLRVVKIIA